MVAYASPLAAFLQNLNTDIAAGTSTSFLTALGRRLVLGHVLLLKFTAATSGEVANLFVTAAAEIMQEPRATTALFEFAKVQQCLRVTFMTEIAVFNCHFPSIRTGSALHI